MVSPDASTEVSGSESSIDEQEKRFYSSQSRQPPSPSQSQSQSQSESQSQSDSSEHISGLPQKKTSARIPTTPTKPPPSSSKPPPSSAKRPRNEEDEPSNKKTKKQKPTKEEPKKTNEDKKKSKKPEPLPSPQKSAKKPTWTPKDDLIFLKALALYCQDGKEFPKNVMTPVYDFVRSLNMLDYEYNNRDLGDKLRRLRTKFFTTVEKVKGGGHSFKTPHDESVYKLSKKVWGREKNVEKEEEESEDEESEKSEELTVKEAELGNGRKDDRVFKKVEKDEEEEEEEDEDSKEEGDKSIGEDVEMTQKENDEDEDEEDQSNTKQNLASSPEMRKHVAVKKETIVTPCVVSNGNISNGVKDYTDGKPVDQIGKEVSVKMNEIKDQMTTENMDIKSEILKMVGEVIREGIHSSVNGKTSNKIGFYSDAVVNRFSQRELPALDVSEARILEQKWKKQHLVELEACSGHLALLQEECHKRMDKLRSLVDEERH